MNWSRQVYGFATWAAQPLLRRKLRRRALQEPGYAEAVEERFGHYQPTDLGCDGRGQWIWIHAVSLGETRAAGILLQALRQQLPGMRLLLTHGTATGRAEGRKLLQPGDVQVWQPWDTAGATRRFVEQFRPAIGILMETEIWPHLVAACQRAGVPLTLANARLNEKSLRGAQRLAALSRPAYVALTAVWAQTEDDARRLRTLGAPVQAVLGNLKFDVQPDPAQLALGRQWRERACGPVIMLASSREGEEALWLDALHKSGLFRAAEPVHQAQAAINSVEAEPALQWLIVPRHPQRFDEVEQLLLQSQYKLSRRSRWPKGKASESLSDTPMAKPRTPEVWLGDSMGELAAYYALADVALLGGSFALLGGQNLIEAAACGCPVVLGPHTFNFAEAAQLACEAGAARRVADMQQAVQVAAELVREPAALAQARQQALEFAQKHRGAAMATAQAIRGCLQANSNSDHELLKG